MSETMIKLMRRLGYLGLLPFLIFAFCLCFNIPLIILDPMTGFISYSAIILSFLCGALWGNSLFITGKPKTGYSAMLLSNIIVLVAWAAILVQFDLLALSALAVGYVMIWLNEWRLRAKVEPAVPVYSRLRFVLTLVVLLTHGLMLYVIISSAIEA